MNYELAEQLKDAGFPQNRVIKNMHKPAVGNGEGDICLNPTLSELIEACGDSFMELSNIDSSHLKPLCGWRAMDTKRNAICGKTPEEAVAKLWLKLNEK